MCDFERATTEVSYSKGIESIVPPVHIFEKAAHWDGSRYKMRADNRDEAVVSIGRRVVVSS